MSSGRYIALDRALLNIEGEDRHTFLQGLITNDINKVNQHQAIYACMLTPQGKFLFDFFIYKIRERLVLEVEKSRAEELKSHLGMYKLRSKVEIKDISNEYEIYAVLGKDGLSLFNLKNAGEIKQFPGGVAIADPRRFYMGIRITIAKDSIPETFAGQKIIWGSPEEYEKLRISLAVPEGGKDMIPEKSFPLQSNMEEMNAIDFNKGCYVGQEVTARSKHRGVIRKKIVKVKIDGDVASGSPVKVDNRQIGEMLSSLNGEGLALLDLDEIKKAADEDKKIQSGNIVLKVV